MQIIRFGGKKTFNVVLYIVSLSGSKLPTPYQFKNKNNGSE